MPTTIQELMARYYATIVVPDVDTDGEPCYVAYHPDLEGCMSHGDTIEEALSNLSEARTLYLSTLLEKGLDIPLPGTETAVVTSAIWQATTSTGKSEGEEESTISCLPASNPVSA